MDKVELSSSHPDDCQNHHGDGQHPQQVLQTRCLLEAHPFQFELLLLIAEALLTPEPPPIDRHRLPSPQSQIRRQQPATDFVVARLAIQHHLQRIALRLVIDDLTQLETLPDLQPILAQLAAKAANLKAGMAFDTDDIAKSLLVQVLQQGDWLKPTVGDNDGFPVSRQAAPEGGKKLHFKGVLLGFERVGGNRPLQDGHGTPSNWHQRREHLIGPDGRPVDDDFQWLARLELQAMMQLAQQAAGCRSEGIPILSRHRRGWKNQRLCFRRSRQSLIEGYFFGVVDRFQDLKAINRTESIGSLDLRLGSLFSSYRLAFAFASAAHLSILRRIGAEDCLHPATSACVIAIKEFRLVVGVVYQFR